MVDVYRLLGNFVLLFCVALKYFCINWLGTMYMPRHFGPILCLKWGVQSATRPCMLFWRFINPWSMGLVSISPLISQQCRCDSTKIFLCKLFPCINELRELARQMSHCIIASLAHLYKELSNQWLPCGGILKQFVCVEWYNSIKTAQ